jgi:nucleoside-diphosphate-sugar epimerase
MKVFIIGATGYVGTAIDNALRARGYHTMGTCRSDESRAILTARGTEAVRADILMPQSLSESVKAADVVIYTPRLSPLEAYKSSDAPWVLEGRALRTIATAMAGTEKTFVFNSGAWVYGTTIGVADEESPLDPPKRLVQRPELEKYVLGMGKIGIRSIVVRTGIVYGGGGGVAALFAQSARERGSATIVGDGGNHWAVLHRDDLGELYNILLERGRPGRVYNATNEHIFLQRDIAQAASRGAGAGGATTCVDPSMLGEFGQCLALDQMISSQRAQSLGWRPTGPSIVRELEDGSYQDAQLAAVS